VDVNWPDLEGMLSQQDERSVGNARPLAGRGAWTGRQNPHRDEISEGKG